MSERRPRVLLADDHPMVLIGLRMLLEPDFEVVGEARDGRALLTAAETLRPDLVIADISLPEINGIEATRRLRAAVPEARVLILSIPTETAWVRAAFAAGVYAYLPKTAAPEEIRSALREVFRDRFYVSPIIALGAIGARLDPPGRPPAQKTAGEALTPRQVEIVRLVGKGLGNKEIASRLGVSVTTVRTHLQKIYDKLRPGSRVELALYAAHVGETFL
jgi:DNA-binding NarL/FixJ family response regulator